MNIFPGVADRLKPGLPPRISAVRVGVPASAGPSIPFPDCLKTGFQPRNPSVPGGISEVPGDSPRAGLLRPLRPPQDVP